MVGFMSGAEELLDVAFALRLKIHSLHYLSLVYYNFSFWKRFVF